MYIPSEKNTGNCQKIGRVINMAEIKKLTKKEKFGMVLDYIQDNEMLVEFINNEINLLTKKASSSTKSKTQLENDNIKSRILEVLMESQEKFTITDFQNTYEEFSISRYSNQKMSALFTQLVNEHKIYKTIDKKKSYFSVKEDV
jgi:hypothetical protein